MSVDKIRYKMDVEDSDSDRKSFHTQKRIANFVFRT